jgi:hypothetical protein
MPFWLSVVLALAGMMYFSLFVEAVFLLLLSDVLYGAQEPKYFNMVFVSFIGGLVAFIIIELFKKKLRFQKF